MRVRFSFLAEHAIAHDDGRFSVLGGGLEAIQAETPVHLTLLLGLAFADEEYGRDKDLSVSVENSQGQRVQGPVSLKFTPRAGLDPEGARKPVHPLAVSTILQLAPGWYGLVVRDGADVVASVPLVAR